MENAIFYRPRHLWRAIICMLIALIFFGLSVSKNLESFRVALDNVTNRIFIFNSGTNQFVNHITPNFKDVGSLTAAYEEAQQQIASLQMQLATAKGIQAENDQLKNLLNLPSSAVARTLVVKTLVTDQGQKNNIIFVDKGSESGVYYGQNVFDAYGLVGQITSVSNNQSRVLLLTDINSYVPVYNINGQEPYIIHGNNAYSLIVSYIPAKSKIQVGDVLYTSGLVKRFIQHYPVAVVTSVQRDNHGNVIAAQAQPTARLNSLRYLVLAWAYCDLLEPTISANLFYQKQYQRPQTSLLSQANRVQSRKRSNFLTYTYQGVDPKQIQVGRWYSSNVPVTQPTPLNYSGDVNITAEHCYTMNGYIPASRIPESRLNAPGHEPSPVIPSIVPSPTPNQVPNLTPRTAPNANPSNVIPSDKPTSSLLRNSLSRMALSSFKRSTVGLTLVAYQAVGELQARDLTLTWDKERTNA